MFIIFKILVFHFKKKKINTDSEHYWEKNYIMNTCSMRERKSSSYEKAIVGIIDTK